MNRKIFFNQIAQEWESSHHPDKEKEKLEQLWRSFSINRGDVVLDVGCGTGRLVPFLIEAVGLEGLVVESDFSEEMLNIAKKKYNQRKLFFLQADAQKLPLRDNRCDAVICLALFPHLPDKPGALKEFRRILKPQKPLYIAHIMSREEVNRIHSRINGPVNKDFLPSQQEMEELFSLTGFKEFTIKDEPSFYLAQAKA